VSKKAQAAAAAGYACYTKPFFRNCRHKGARSKQFASRTAPKGLCCAVLCLSEEPQKALKPTLFLERAKPALPYGGVLASRRLCRPHGGFHSENASFPISFHDAKTGFLTV